MNKLYQLETSVATEEKTAWAKAPSDVRDICRQMGAKDYRVGYVLHDIRHLHWLVRRMVSLFRRAIWYCSCLVGPRVFEDGSYLVVQYPSIGFEGHRGWDFGRRFLRLLLNRSKSKLILVIHDIETIRGAFRGPTTMDEALKSTLLDFRIVDKFIVHNHRMAQWFVNKGCDPNKVVELGVFDYLSSYVPQLTVPFERAVIVAGNLLPAKVGYLRQLSSVEVTWYLYGTGFKAEDFNSTRVHYCGSFSPNEILGKLRTCFALVWDGDSIDGCTGPYGEYQRYNNPHKLSLYLAAGLPVIIWSQAAEAEFVLRHHVGLTVDSLRELPSRIASISDAEISVMRENATRLAGMVSRGLFMKHALEEAIK